MTERIGKRVVLVKPNEDLQLWERLVPQPKADEVLLKVEMGGVCGTDIHFWKGEVPLPGPIGLGHEGIGRVEELGSAVSTDHAGTSIKQGDRVYWIPVHPCGRCYYCSVEKDGSRCERVLETMFLDGNESVSSGYSEYARIPAGMPFYRIPDDTPSEAVIAFGCAMPTMLQGLERLGDISINQTVVVQGSGPVGLAATMLAKIRGARDIIVIGAPKKRLEMALALGAKTIISVDEYDAEARIAKVQELTEGRGADVVIEAAGVVPAFAEGIKMTASGGRYLLVGLWSAPGTVEVEPRYLNNMNLQIIGTSMFQARHIYQAVQVAQQFHRDFPMTEVVTDRYSLSDCQCALEGVANLKTVKSVIVP